MLLIRADADTRMGTGHVMRCLALAQAWQDAGGQVTFLSAPLPAGLESRLVAEGMAVVTLDADAAQTARTARELGADWIVLDGYHFDARYQKALKECLKDPESPPRPQFWGSLDSPVGAAPRGRPLVAEGAAGSAPTVSGSSPGCPLAPPSGPVGPELGAGGTLLILDDNGDADFYYADVVLNQNVHAQAGWYASRAPDTRLLLGTRFALLRREFLAHRDSPRETPEAARRVLVTLGGSDPDNVTLKVLDSLALIEREGLDVIIVVGGGNPHRAGLEDVAARLPCPVRVVVNAADMPALMAWADVAVSAAGSTVWELAFLGVPALLVVTAENQLGIAEGMDAAGAAHSLGRASDVTASALASSLTALLDDPQRQAEMSRKARALVDGRGAERVLEVMRS